MQVKSPFGKTQAALKEPSGDYDQATKKYVDESIVDHRNDTSVHLTLAQNIWLGGINATQAEVNYLNGATSSIQGQLNTKLGLAGGTLTGPLILSANPTLNLGAATKQYVDTADAASKDRANHTGTQPISSVTDLQNQLNLAKGLGTGLSTQDPNLATEHVILSDHANTPNASFYWHITTTFWSTMDSNSNRGQIAVQHNGGASVYARSCYSGVWTAWQRLDNAGVSASQISTGTLPDGRLSGTYTSASVGGNAATATKLQTARTINGVNFDGSSNIVISDESKLPLAGGTLTGMLTLSASPTLALHAATKGYVDSAITSIPSSSLTGIIADARLSGTYTNASVGGNAATATKLQTGRTINGVEFDGSTNITVADSTKLPTTGGVMTGFLTLHADPTANMHAVTKKYVDDTMVGISYSVATTTTDGLMSSIDKVKLNGIATSATANQTDAYLTNRANHTGTQAISTVSDLQTTLDGKLPLAGGTLTGMLTLSGGPTVNLHAATKQYVDTADAVSKDRANHTGTQAISTVTDLQNQINLARGLAAGTSSQDPNIAVDNVIVTNHANTPNSAYFWHITTTFYAGISSVANRGQIAVQYNGGISVYGRSHFSNAWTAWTRLDQDATKLPLAGGTMTGMLTTRMSSDSAVSLTAMIGSASLQVMGDNTRGAWLSFHRSGTYAINLGLDTDNVFKLGGWSSGDGNTAFSCTGGGNFQVKSSVSFPSMPHNTNSGSAATVNFGTGQKQMLRLTAPCSVTFSFPGIGNYQLIIEQDGTGNRTLSYAQSVNFLGSATAPAINTGAWTHTILSVFWSGSNIYIGGSKVNAA